MREIKYKAWDKENKLMIPWEDFKFIGISFYEIVESNLIVLRQYTGLKDKDGVEIYEGDIVRSFNDYWDDCTHLDLVCRYDESEFLFGDHPWCEVGSNKCEVIGNIYEHPELLEE